MTNSDKSGQNLSYLSVMNKKEAAAYLGISERTLIRYTTAGKISASEKRGKTGMITDYAEENLQTFKAFLGGEIAEGVTVGVTVAPKSDSTALARIDKSPRALAVTNSDKPRNAVTKAVVPIEHKLILTLPEARAMTGFGPKLLGEAMKAGELHARKIGGSWRIKRSDLDAYVKKL